MVVVVVGMHAGRQGTAAALTLAASSPPGVKVYACACVCMRVYVCVCVYLCVCICVYVFVCMRFYFCTMGSRFCASRVVTARTGQAVCRAVVD